MLVTLNNLLKLNPSILCIVYVKSSSSVLLWMTSNWHVLHDMPQNMSATNNALTTPESLKSTGNNNNDDPTIVLEIDIIVYMEVFLGALSTLYLWIDFLSSFFSWNDNFLAAPTCWSISYCNNASFINAFAIIFSSNYLKWVGTPMKWIMNYNCGLVNKNIKTNSTWLNSVLILNLVQVIRTLRN